MSQDTQRKLTLAALLLAASTLLSRLLGYARDAVIAFQLGAGADTDAYFAAFLLPDMLHYFLAGGALSISFIPLFSRLRSEGRESEGWRLFSNVVTSLGLVLSVAVVIAWFAAPSVVPLLFPGFNPAQVETTVYLTRIILPGPVCFFIGGLLIATEVCRQRFLAAALSPLIYNLCIIAGGLLLAPRFGVAGFSWGVLAGAVLGPLLVPLLFARDAIRYRPQIRLRDPLLRRYFYLALPLMLGISLITVDEWYGRYFGSMLAEGSITWLNNARRLMLVPVALVGQAIAQASLPFLAKLAAERDEDSFRATLRSALEAAATLAAFAAVGLWLVAEPFARFVYQRGAFLADDTARTASLLAILSFATIGWCVQMVAVRAFYAREDTWRPMWAGTFVALLTLPLYAFLARRLDVEGIALATAAGMTLNALAILLLYRRCHGTTLLPQVLRGLGVALLLSIPAGAVTMLVRNRMEAGWGDDPSAMAGLATVLVCALCFSVLSLPPLVLGRGPAATLIRRRLPGRLRRLLPGTKTR